MSTGKAVRRGRSSKSADLPIKKNQPPRSRSRDRFGTPIAGAPGAYQSVVRNQKSEILLGAHMSIGGGAHMAIERARSIDCTAMQIFVKNNMQWFARPLTPAQITAFLKHYQRK